MRSWQNWIEIEKFRVVTVAAFFVKISENPSKFHENQRKSRRNLEKIELFSVSFLIMNEPSELFSVSNFENAVKIDEHLLKYWGLSGAKACKSCRSRQEFSNEYFLAKFGFDTADNEPDETPPGDLIFTYIPRPMKTRASRWIVIRDSRERAVWRWIFDDFGDVDEVAMNTTRSRVGHRRRPQAPCGSLGPSLLRARMNNIEFLTFFMFPVKFCIFFCECLMKFCPDFATNSRKEWRLSLLQSILRKQIRKLPNFLKFVKIILYYSILFIRVLTRHGVVG